MAVGRARRHSVSASSEPVGFGTRIFRPALPICPSPTVNTPAVVDRDKSYGILQHSDACLCGAVGLAVSTLLLHPLEALQIQIQEGQFALPRRPLVPSFVLGVKEVGLRLVGKRDGMGHLWGGLTANILHNVSYFLCFEFLTHSLEKTLGLTEEEEEESDLSFSDFVDDEDLEGEDFRYMSQFSTPTSSTQANEGTPTYSPMSVGKRVHKLIVSVHPSMRWYLMRIFSMGVCSLVTYPFEAIKTRIIVANGALLAGRVQLQSQHSTLSPGGNRGGYWGGTLVCQRTAQSTQLSALIGAPKSLWDGYYETLWSLVVVEIGEGAFSNLSAVFTDHRLGRLMCNMLGYVVSDAINYPLITVGRKLCVVQLGLVDGYSGGKGFLRCCEHVVNKSGWRGFYRGIGVSLPISGLFFIGCVGVSMACYNWLSAYRQSKNLITSMRGFVYRR